MRAQVSIFAIRKINWWRWVPGAGNHGVTLFRFNPFLDSFQSENKDAAPFLRSSSCLIRTAKSGSFSRLNSMEKPRSLEFVHSFNLCLVIVTHNTRDERSSQGCHQDPQDSNNPSPRVQHAFFMLPERRWKFEKNLLHGIKLVTSPSSENSGSKIKGKSNKTGFISLHDRLNRLETLSKTFCSG